MAILKCACCNTQPALLAVKWRPCTAKNTRWKLVPCHPIGKKSAFKKLLKSTREEFLPTNFFRPIGLHVALHQKREIQSPPVLVFSSVHRTDLCHGRGRLPAAIFPVKTQPNVEGRGKGKGRWRLRKGEREIGSEALAETEKIANAPVRNRTRDPSEHGWCSTTFAFGKVPLPFPFPLPSTFPASA